MHHDIVAVLQFERLINEYYFYGLKFLCYLQIIINSYDFNITIIITYSFKSLSYMYAFIPRFAFQIQKFNV